MDPKFTGLPGDQDKYAEGWERVFGGGDKKEEPMAEKKQGWFQIPVGPGLDPKFGYFINGKLQAWAFADGSWCLHTSSDVLTAPTFADAQRQAEQAVWAEEAEG
jgi:hypothetical protein